MSNVCSLLSGAGADGSFVQSAPAAVAIAYEHDSQGGNHAESMPRANRRYGAYRRHNQAQKPPAKRKNIFFTLTPGLSICYNAK